MMYAGFTGYCRFCGKPCYRGDEKVTSGKGNTKTIIVFHKRCWEHEQKQIKEVKK